MNGYYCEHMATFMCNHAFQVLLGGRDVTDRIHYCCKYVTKQQKQLGRKWVAALIYNLTNRQEIAGPLAALYLYRGSCCYSRAKCATLPLGDIIQQLMRAEDYSCTLVNASASLESSHFRAVSFLDD
ncbi:hypothetical protein JG687_00008527 [Phytophthora cactorum]|uniref:Uncharacterized protein n=1 Tax=Phytophthora cactorum TaxID=29920 RepID=A0A8T1UGN1_9STRA|nr:hypothetical protein JG687_00008527 [Phytophthora cactorum]